MAFGYIVANGFALASTYFKEDRQRTGNFPGNDLARSAENCRAGTSPKNQNHQK
jgi:hypothetical protein